MTEIALPTDLSSAHAMILEIHAQFHELRGEYDEIKHRLDEMCRRLYGRRSEQIDPAQIQFACATLEAEALGETLPPPPAPSVESAPAGEPKEKRPGHGRRALPKSLPRERRVIEPAEDDLVCSCCGRSKVCIGIDPAAIERCPVAL